MTIAFFKTQFEQVWNGVPWYGTPFEKTLKELNKAYVFKRGDGFTHSIAEILVHINAWRTNMLEMLKGNGDYVIDLDGEMDWSKKVEQHTWEELLAESTALQQQLLTLLDAQNDDILKQKVPGRKYNFEYLINGTIQHDIYHLGQIRQQFRYFENTQ